jgi:hypothetical protein
MTRSTLRLATSLLAGALAACTAPSDGGKLLLGADCGGLDERCLSALCYELDSASSICTETCTTNADCPARFVCDSVPGISNTLVCLPVGLGGRCKADPDCPAGHKCDADVGRCYIPVSRDLCSPCTSPLQCPQGGACVTVAETGESYCTRGCSGGGDCPVGFACQNVPGSTATQCVPANPQQTCHAGRGLCDPCRSDEECGGARDRCVRNVASGEQFCGTACELNADCPAGFNCLDLSGSGRGPRQCVPNAQTCAGYCESDEPAYVRRHCGLGAGCDTASRRCEPATDGRLCAACEDDDGCPSQDGTTRCVVNNCPDCPFRGEKFCASSCAGPRGGKDDSKCPVGFFCAGLGAGGETAPWHCVPVTGSCKAGAGALGDDCTGKGGAQCSSGICLGFGSQGLCSLACGQDGDCGDGRYKCCATVDGGKTYDCSQAPSDGKGVCSPRGGAFGADCSPGQPPCFGGTCLDLGTARLCSQRCADAAACPSGFTCRPGRIPKGDGTFEPVDVCFPDGGGTLGSDCSFGPAACQTGYCLKKASGNLCTQPCSDAAPCGDGYTCDEATALDGTPDGAAGRFCVPDNL